jgi:hypothetical protein
MIERRGAIALDLQQLAVPHMQQYATAAVATAADALEDGGGRLPAGRQREGWLLDGHAIKTNGARTGGLVLGIAGSPVSMLSRFGPCQGASRRHCKLGTVGANLA